MTAISYLAPVFFRPRRGIKSPGYQTTLVQTGFPSRIYPASLRSRGVQPPANKNKLDCYLIFGPRFLSAPPGDKIPRLPNFARSNGLPQPDLSGVAP
ncbi:MAG: hypothetical protein HUU38_01990 [Anaerolineales bacterium]|nr:hypothetical protein [Anaerolineales bacterium]